MKTMRKANPTLELTQSELDVLEAALQTQIKILSLGAEAGATAAQTGLNDVKQVLARIAPLRKSEETTKPRQMSWLMRSLRLS